MSKRKQFTPEQKVAMVRRHLLENVPVSDLCDEVGIDATQFYNWQKQLFENAAGVHALVAGRAHSLIFLGWMLQSGAQSALSQRRPPTRAHSTLRAIARLFVTQRLLFP